jgi:hypothetical protein
MLASGMGQPPSRDIEQVELVDARIASSIGVDINADHSSTPAAKIPQTAPIRDPVILQTGTPTATHIQNDALSFKHGLNTSVERHGTIHIGESPEATLRVKPSLKRLH